MSDIDNPVTGKDTQLRVLVDGVLAIVQDQVTKFEANAEYDEVETKFMGKFGREIDKVLLGWAGSIEFRKSRRELDDVIDIVNEARKNRIPILINVVETTRYRNGVARTYVYPDIKPEFQRSSSRGEADTVSWPWKSGRDRILAA